MTQAAREFLYPALGRLSEIVSAVRPGAIPAEAIETARSAFIDYAGVVLAGVDEEAARAVRGMVEAFGGNPQASVWGTSLRTSMANAALANGTAAHALEFDDTNSVMIGHPSVQILPALSAMAEWKGASGLEALVAYVAGFEAGVRLGRAMNPEHVVRGWVPVGTLGPVMQAAACSNLLGLPAEKTRMALGIAMNHSSGLRRNNGAMAKPLLAGHAAASGAVAALLAREGLTSAADALEGSLGFYEDFCAEGAASRLAESMALPGDNLGILDSGVSFKLYPCCAGGHGAVDAALEIARRHRPRPAEITAVDVDIRAGARVVLMHHSPRTVEEARFSLEYFVARSLIDGGLGLEQFTADKVLDPEARTLMGKVRPEYIEIERARASRPFPVSVRVTLRGGRVLSAVTEHARGTAGNPATMAELTAKFLCCAALRFGRDRAAGLLERLSSLDESKDFSEIAGALRGE